MKNVLIFFAFILQTLALSAQTADTEDVTTISGKVTDDFGNIVSSASVIIRTNYRYTQTDAKGNFEINASLGEYVNIYKEGYYPKSVNVDSSMMNIRLVKASGRDYQIDKTISVEEGYVQGFVLNENNEAMLGIAVLLAGKPGVGVVADENGQFKLKVEKDDIVDIGFPGYERQRIPVAEIKGEVTVIMKIISGDALVIIDGEEGSLDGIRPQDIETFNVLKDRSATNAYGEKGRYGVVEVTTKNNKKSTTIKK